MSLVEMTCRSGTRCLSVSMLRREPRAQIKSFERGVVDPVKVSDSICDCRADHGGLQVKPACSIEKSLFQLRRRSHQLSSQHSPSTGVRRAHLCDARNSTILRRISRRSVAP